jgi:GAF domain-containing protein
VAPSSFATTSGPDSQGPLPLQTSLPSEWEDLARVDLATGLPEAEVVDAALAQLGQQLRCDRVFLYLRSPPTRLGRVAFCWRQHEAVPLVYDPDWKTEPTSLPDEDPLFAAALQGKPSIFVDDVKAASPAMLNYEFECQTFGHRALIHAHLWADRQLWGVLQACKLETPRPWSPSDRQLVDQAVAAFTPFAQAYVRSHYPNP